MAIALLPTGHINIPILMLLYFTVSGINDNINLAKLEILGNRFLLPLTKLLVLVQEVVVTAQTELMLEIIKSAQQISQLIENLVQERASIEI